MAVVAADVYVLVSLYSAMNYSLNSILTNVLTKTMEFYFEMPVRELIYYFDVSFLD